MRASANFSSSSDVSSSSHDENSNKHAYSKENLGTDEAKAGAHPIIASLTLEQTVLAVFRPRPHLPSAAPEKKKSGLAGESKKKGGKYKEIDEGEGWSISSLLLPPSARKSRENFSLKGCPVASRSAIHVLGAVGGKTGKDAAAAERRTAAGGDDETAPNEDVTWLLSSPYSATGDDKKSRASGGGASKAPSSIERFLREKLWNDDNDNGENDDINSPKEASPQVSARGNIGVLGEADGATLSSSAAPAVAWLDHFLAGRGGTRGVSVSHLVNMHPTEDAYVEFLQPVPYFMEPLAGTLRARVVPSCSESIPLQRGAAVMAEEDMSLTAGADRRGESQNGVDAIGQGCVGVGLGEGRSGTNPPAGSLLSLGQNVTLTPGVERRPAVVEARLWVPAASTLVLGFDYFKRFLTVDDFPPDPSRGLDIPPPLARFYFAGLEQPASRLSGCEVKGEGALEGRSYSGNCPAGGGSGPEEMVRVEGGGGGGRGRVVYAYGEAGLLDTPQPDFSMPFNVITFTSTVITFFLGTAINLLVRKSKAKKKKMKKGPREGGGGGGEGDLAESSSSDGDGESQEGGGVRELLRRSQKSLGGAIGFLKGGGGRIRDRQQGLKED